MQGQVCANAACAYEYSPRVYRCPKCRHFSPVVAAESGKGLPAIVMLSIVSAVFATAAVTQHLGGPMPVPLLLLVLGGCFLLGLMLWAYAVNFFLDRGRSPVLRAAIAEKHAEDAAARRQLMKDSREAEARNQGRQEEERRQDEARWKQEEPVISAEAAAGNALYDSDGDPRIRFDPQSLRLTLHAGPRSTHPSVVEAADLVAV
jgi:hypothetical protein